MADTFKEALVDELGKYAEALEIIKARIEWLDKERDVVLARMNKVVKQREHVKALLAFKEEEDAD